jgi:hypothetical protein
MLAIRKHPTKRGRLHGERQLMITSAILLAVTSTVAEQTYTGSATVPVTDDTIIVSDFKPEKFARFAQESLSQYFRLRDSIRPIIRASSTNAIQDIELVGPSKCLARNLAVVGWQRLRFEVSYRIDDSHFMKTTQVRYQFLLRLISGELADFPWEREPPPERFKQISSHDLTDLAGKVAGFIKQEMARSCFDTKTLQFCSPPKDGACR